jgi:hypothetical protein
MRFRQTIPSGLSEQHDGVQLMVETRNKTRADNDGRDLAVNTERVNEAVREHEIQADWEHRALAEILHVWIERFNSESFDGALPLGFLQLRQARYTTLGHYRPGRNDVGALHEIALNTLHLDRPLGEILGTLLHELVHLWQQLYGKPGKGNYHNRQFVEKCLSLGIPCTGGHRSHTLGYQDPFVSLLRRYGVDIEYQESAAEAKPEAPEQLRGSSKLKKWTCGCTNVWAAKVVEAQCCRCGQLFIRPD